MPIVDITEIDDLLGADRTVAGIDLGTKTIGLAVSDLGLSFATPRAMIKRVKFTQDATALKLALDEARCGALVLGLPLNMDGTQGPRAQATRAFARNWSGLDDRPLAFWDERLSTVAAERVLIAADVSRAKRATRIDSAAAAFILQGALDRLAALRSARGPQ